MSAFNVLADLALGGTGDPRTIRALQSISVQQSSLSDSLLSISISNDRRAAEARRLAGAIYFLVALEMLLLCIILGVQMSWCFPLWRKNHPQLGVATWVLLFFVICEVVSLGAGLPGWIFCLAPLVGLATLFWAFYAVLRWRTLDPLSEIIDPNKRAELLEEDAIHDLGETSSTSGSTNLESRSTASKKSMGTGGSTGTSGSLSGSSGTSASDSGGIRKGNIGRKGKKVPPSALARRRLTAKSRAAGGVAASSHSWVMPELPVTSFPRRLGRFQRPLAYSSTGLFLILSFVIALIFFSAPLRPHLSFSPGRGRGVPDPVHGAVVDRTFALMYAFPGVARALRMDYFNRWANDACQSRFSSVLDKDGRRTEILLGLIVPYDIDMIDFEPASFADYPTLNDFLQRSLASGARDLAGSKLGGAAVISAADSRVTAFPTFGAFESVWLKGEKFNLGKLLGSSSLVPSFEGGSILVHRLTMGDYHRFHAPVSGVVESSVSITSSTLHPPEAIKSRNRAIYNVRRVMILRSSLGARVAVVAIGSVCAGSVTFARNSGDTVTRGQEIGTFAFGGSTVVVIFPKGTVSISQDLILASQTGVETIVKVGESIGSL